MGYKKYYDEIVDGNIRYTANEKQMIKRILMLLNSEKIPDEIKKTYIYRLDETLKIIDRQFNLVNKIDESNHTQFDSTELFQKILLEIMTIEFKLNCEEIQKDIHQVEVGLNSSKESINTLKFKRYIDIIDKKFIKLFGNTGEKVNLLIRDINEFKDKNSDSKFVLSTDDINNRINEIKDQIKGIKLKYIEKYNMIIDDTNKRMQELDLDTERFSKFEVSKAFAFNNRLESVKSNKLIGVIKKIGDIDKADLSDTSTKYLVNSVKSAKELYQKDDKLSLIVSGVSSLSLIDFVVGPVITPAVMCGNLALKRKSNYNTDGINKVLASVIDATKEGNNYKLHTGVELNEEIASVSILKTIAVSEDKKMLVPLVYDAKKLFEKIKLYRLKEKISLPKDENITRILDNGVGGRNGR